MLVRYTCCTIDLCKSQAINIDTLNRRTPGDFRLAKHHLKLASPSSTRPNRTTHNRPRLSFILCGQLELVLSRLTDPIAAFPYNSPNLHFVKTPSLPTFIMTRAQQTLSVLLLVSSVCRKSSTLHPQTQPRTYPRMHSLTCLIALPLPLPRPGPPERDRPDRDHPRGTSRQRNLPLTRANNPNPRD